jgi:predicted CxxxxCH...CXXCH cytochrome family protein
MKSNWYSLCIRQVVLLSLLFSINCGIAFADTVILRPDGVSGAGTWTGVTAANLNDQSDATLASISDATVSTFTVTMANSAAYAGATIDSIDIYVQASATGGGQGEKVDFGPNAVSGTSVTVSPRDAFNPYTKPFTGFTPATVDSLTVAVSNASQAAGEVMRVSDIWVVVNYTLPCTPANMTIDISPVNQTLASGAIVNYTVSVTNNDSAFCAPLTVNLGIADTGATTQFVVPSILSAASIVSLAPGASDNVTLTVTAQPAGTDSSALTSTVTASATGHTNQAAAAVSTISNNNPLIHNSVATGSGTSKWPSGWGVAGGEYGEFTCDTCHTRNTTNIKRIRTTLTAPTGTFPIAAGTVQLLTVAEGSSQLGDDSGGHATSNRICEACHSKNKFHNYDTANNLANGGNLTHANQTDCLACHPHRQGFKSPGCDSCHGNPPITADTNGSTTTGLVHAPALTDATTPASPGAHARHSVALTMKCETCHKGNTMPTVSYTIEMGIEANATNVPGFNGTVTGGTLSVPQDARLLNGFTFAAADGVTTVTKVANDTLNCTVYCHGNWAGSGGTITNPSWVGTSQATCGACHGASAGTPPATGGHQTHAGNLAGDLALSCDLCHPTVSDPSHLNGNVAWQLPTGDSRFGASAIYRTGASGSTGSKAPSATYGNCTVYCHGSNTPLWGGTTLTCVGCHGASNNGDLSVSSTVGHGIHFNSATAATSLSQADSFTSGYVYGCANCHPTATHVNGPASATRAAELTGSKMGGYAEGAAQTDAKGFKFTNGTCTTVCHSSDGASGSPIVTPVWNGTKTTPNCGVCHNKAGDGSPVWTTPHTAHINTYSVNTNLTCNSCHNITAASNTAINATAAARTQHPNAAKNVDFNTFAGGAWSGTQCSNTYCHSPGTAASGTHANISWSGTMLADCGSCHGSDSIAASKIATNAHDAHTNDTTNQVGFNVTCSTCHNATTTAVRTVSDKALHVNKNVNVRFDNGTLVKNTDLPLYNGASAQSGVAGGVSKAAGSAVASCAAVYCHSIGNLDATGAVITAGAANFRTVAWNATITGCDDCHGDLAGKSHPTYTTGAAGGTTANSHVKHVEGSSLSCDYCHNTTTTNATIPPTTVLAAGQHLDRTEDVSFKSNGGKTGVFNAGKTCSATYCHGTAASVAWGGTTTCASCHGAANDGTMSTSTTGHAIHYNTATVATSLSQANDFTSTYAYGCSNCHPTATHSQGPADATAPLQDAEVLGTKVSVYTQGGASTTDSKGFNYTTNGTCTTVCHTRDGISGAPIVTPAWNGAKTTPNCGVCHNKQGDASPVWSTLHTKHINTYSANSNITCNSCHNTTAASNTAINTTAAARNQHPNAAKNVDFNAWTSGTWSGTQCSNTYCHTNGVAATHGVISWSGTLGCTGCHGAGGATTTTLSASHLVHIGSGTTDVNKQFAMTCDDCHATTANSTPAITSFTQHINKTKEVAVLAGNGGTGTNGGDYGGSTCTTTNCHGSASPTWSGGATNGDCSACHGMAALSGGNVIASATMKDTNGDTVATDLQVGAHAAHLTTSATFGAMTCNQCHLTTVTNINAAATYVAKVNATGHIDSGLTAELTWGTIATAGDTLTPLYNGTTCSANYCHGASFADGGTNKSPQWTQTTYLDGTITVAQCGTCHGAPPTGSPHSGQPLTECGSCHTSTMNNGAATFLDVTKHANGIIEASTTCGGCHTAFPPATGAHVKHVDHLVNDMGLALGVTTNDMTLFSNGTYTACAVCHDMSNTANHTNATDYILGLPKVSQQFVTGTNPTYDPTTTFKCSNVNCHFKPTPAWK